MEKGNLKMSRWKYVNKTTGRQMGCNNLLFMLHRLRNEQGLMIPEGSEVTIRLWGAIELVVLDEEGVLNEFSILDELRDDVASTTLSAIQ